MPEQFLPRKLPRNRDYPGYQFYCVMRKQDSDAEACFCTAALCVIDWLKKRLRGTDVIPGQIARLPGRQQAGEIAPSDLESFTISSGFSAYAVSLPSHGIWALRLKEADSDTGDRKAVPGRFFATNIGLHILNGREVELGLRIDVTDPEDIPEVEFAFRPGLVRYLHEMPGLRLSQVGELPYRQAIPVENEAQLKKLRTLLDSSEGTMPLILATQGVRLPKESPAPPAGRSPFPPGLSFPPALFPALLPETYDPFDADDIAGHNFGYAITFRVSEKMHRPLAARLKKDYTPGDILFVEPKRYGGSIRIVGKDEEDPVGQVWRRAHVYSKNRKYSFGDVQFEFDARNVENRELIERIRASGEMETAEKLSALNRKIDELQQENEKRVQKINELKQQLLNEFTRGEDEEKRRTAQLSADFDRQKDELRGIKSRNRQLEQENREARAFRAAAEAFRCMPELPQDNEAVLHYFRQVFPDRLAFTVRGFRSGCRCDIRPEGLWYYLYRMATSLYEIHHAGRPDVEKEFLHATGIEVAMGERKLTNRGSEFRRLRDDTYEGRAICVAPHVKLDDRRSGGENRRIYYCYDRELDKIIIGWIGEHLDTAGTMHMS